MIEALVKTTGNLVEIEELKPEQVFPELAPYKPTLSHRLAWLDEDKQTVRREVERGAEERIMGAPLQQVKLMARRDHAHHPMIGNQYYSDAIAYRIIEGGVPELGMFRLPAFLWRAGKIRRIWERKGSIDIPDLRERVIQAMNDLLNAVDEKHKRQIESVQALEEAGYFNPDILREVPLPVGIITSIASIDRRYQSDKKYPVGQIYSFHVEPDLDYIKLAPVLAVPFSALASRHFEEYWIVTNGRVKSHGPIPLEIDYADERVDVVSGRAKSFSAGFIVTTNETTLDLRHESRTKTAIYTSKAVEIPLIMERDGVEIPCTYNAYDVPKISGFSPDVRLRLRRNFAEDVPQSQLTSPSVLSAFLEGRKGQEVIVGGRMQNGLLRIDTIFGQNLEFRYFAHLDAEININHYERNL